MGGERVHVGGILDELKQLLMLVHDSGEIMGRLQVLGENGMCDGKDFLSMGADYSTKRTANVEKKIWAHHKGVDCRDIWM